ncbi:MAG: tyrosine recombinase XerC [Clostridia bacterium]|nr:tyrosine recombinase XerC [Clostridia bacterium]
MNTYASKQADILSKMPQSVKEFAIYKTAIENCSPKTVEEYILDLRTFFRYIMSQREGVILDSEEFYELDISKADIDFVKSIKTDEIYEFLLYVGQYRNNSWSAKSRKLSALKSYFKFMTVKKHCLEDNPVINIEAPKKKKSLPKYLNLEESKGLLEAVKNDKDSKTKERDYAIITLFLNCGMRLSELVGINLTDIDSQMRCLKVTGKGAKERIIYLNDACKSAIVEYLNTRTPQTKNSSSAPLFLSAREQRISPKTVQYTVNKYLKLAGLEYKGFSTHKLRHTAATLMYQSGNVDVRVLKDILGHEQLNTTQIYTHISDASMESAMYANPLSSIKAPAADTEKNLKKNED